MGALPFLIRTRLEYAELLGGSGPEGERGLELLQQALTLADRLNLPRLGQCASGLLEAQRRAGVVA